VNSKNSKILVIGLGEIGYNNCEYMTKKGIEVDGYDIKKRAVNNALKARIIQKEAKDFKNYDYYIICISTHNPKNILKPSLNGFFKVIEKLAKEGKYGSLVTIESTITKGTCQKAVKILKHKQHLVHVPHRFYCNDKILHGINQERILGGCFNCCKAEAIFFYEQILDIKNLYIVNKIELAELSKIIENSYRFLQIAFSEELKTYCDNNNLNFKELREAINTKWNIQLLEARQGIGGHCLPKDSDMYLNLLKKFVPHPIIESAINADKYYKQQEKPEKQIQTTLSLARKTF
jgi:nucleotide sugar dehydrogenase